MVRTRNGSIAVAAAAAAEAIMTAETKAQQKQQQRKDQLDRAEVAAAVASLVTANEVEAMEVAEEEEVETAVHRHDQQQQLQEADDARVFGDEEEEDEPELTNLTWLHSLNIMSASGLPTPPCSPSPPPLQHQPAARQQQQQQPQQPKKMSPLLKAQLDLAENAEMYLVDANKKPPYSYATLISLAMRANDNRVTLSNIYAWIRDNFRYYKHADPAWQNSIRHNLSLNKCFVKLPRTKEEPGKGGFWKLDLDRLEEGRRTRRRCGTESSRRSRFPQKRSSPAAVAKTTIATTKTTTTTIVRSKREAKLSEEADRVAKILNNDGTNGPRCIVLYETPPSSVSPPIPDTLAEVPETSQVCINEEDITDILIDTAWDAGVENQLALLDSVLDML